MLRPVAAALALALVVVPAAWAAPSTDVTDMPAGTYVLDKDHASIIAKVRHQGFSDYTVRFTGFDASFVWDPKSPTASKVTATIAAASLDTGNPEHSKKFAQEFLAAGKAPTITSTSTAITPGEGNKGTMTGDLTLRGVTRPVTLDVTWNGYANVLGSQRTGFSATTTIKRSEFGSEFLLKPPLAMVGDDVQLILELEFAKK